MPGGSYSSLAPLRGDMDTPLVELASLSAFPRHLCPRGSASFWGGRPLVSVRQAMNRHRVGLRSHGVDVRKVGPLQLLTCGGPTHASRSGHDCVIKNLFFIKSPLDKFAKTTCLLVMGMPDLRSPGTHSSQGRDLSAAASSLGPGFGQDVQYLFICCKTCRGAQQCPARHIPAETAGRPALLLPAVTRCLAELVSLVFPDGTEV